MPARLMRTILLLLALGALAPPLWPVPVRAAAPVDCSAYVNGLAKDLKTNTTMVDDLARPYDPSADHVAQSAAAYNKYVDSFALCPSSKTTYKDALLATWKAWLDHATTHANPAGTTEIAARKLQQCSVAYWGTDDGATCASWQRQVTAWQNEWSSP